MTRILVCGTVDDPTFIFSQLDEFHREYGPISCVIHSNHEHALAWQQRASRTQPIKHMPIVEDWTHDGVAAPARCRDRLFKVGQPDYLIVFQMPGKRDRREKTAKLVTWAENRGVPVIVFEPDPVAPKRGRPPQGALALFAPA